MNSMMQLYLGANSRGHCKCASIHEDSKSSSDPNTNQEEADQHISIHLDNKEDVDTFIETFADLAFILFNLSAFVRYITVLKSPAILRQMTY